MSDITEEDVMKYCYSRNLMLVTKESLEYMHRPIVIETMNKNAIPIEWIKKWCNEHNRKSLEERLLKRYGVITMLEDWEKENQSLE